MHVPVQHVGSKAAAGGGTPRCARRRRQRRRRRHRHARAADRAVTLVFVFRADDGLAATTTRGALRGEAGCETKSLRALLGVADALEAAARRRCSGALEATCARCPRASHGSRKTLRSGSTRCPRCWSSRWSTSTMSTTRTATAHTCAAARTWPDTTSSASEAAALMELESKTGNTPKRPVEGCYGLPRRARDQFSE